MNSNNNIARFSACVPGLILTFGLLLSLLPAVAFAQTQTQAVALQIGILPMSTTRILLKNYQPLHVYLERVLKRPVELVTAHDFRTFHFNTIEGKYDVVITAAHLGRLAQTEAGYMPLARYKAPNYTLLLVAKDQPLKSVQDIRGKVVAGINPITLAVNETIIWLRGQGLNAGADYALLETPTPISAAYAVQNHQSVMAISSSQGLKQFPQNLKENVIVFATLPELPSLMWLAHPRMTAEIAGLKAALLGFTSESTEGAIFYDTTGYVGMREVTSKESSAMDQLAQEVNALLHRKK